MTDRRRFLIGAAAACLATGRLNGAETSKRSPICVFTKPFQSLRYDQLADGVASLGVDGVEATIRDGGHIEPANVPDELPKMVESLRKKGLEITVMTSSINDPDDPMTEKVLRVAAELGIRRYRMKYFRYETGQPVRKQIANWRSRFEALAAMNKDIGIRAIYQNHAGDKTLGAAIWDIAEVLRHISREQIGVAFDIRHATVEGGMSWPTTFRMIQPHLDTVYVKDFQWNESPRPFNVPLGQGRVDKRFFRMLDDLNFDGPISLHEEYIDHKDPSLVPDHWNAIRRDLAVLRGWLGRSSQEVDGN